MEQDLEKTIAVVLIIGLTFLIMATYAFLNTSYSDSIPKVTTSSSNSFLANYNSNSTLTNTPSAVSSVTAKNQTWLEFDGVNDEVTFSGNPLANIRHKDNTTYTVWINTSMNTGNAEKRDIIDISSSRYNLLTNGPNLTFFIQNETSIPFNLNYYPINDSKWHFVAISFNWSSKNASLYVDGSLINESLVGNLNSMTVATIRVGRGTSGFFNGSIDDVRVYNRTLTKNEIIGLNNSGRNIMNTTAKLGLRFYAPFNEGTGTTIHSFNQSDFA